MPAIFFGGGRWTRSVVRLPDVKGKNIIGPFQRSKSRTFCWKQIRSFSTTIECDNTRRAFLETWKYYGRLRAEASALSDFYSFQKQKTHFRQLVLNLLQIALVYHRGMRRGMFVYTCL